MKLKLYISSDLEENILKIIKKISKSSCNFIIGNVAIKMIESKVEGYCLLLVHSNLQKFNYR